MKRTALKLALLMLAAPAWALEPAPATVVTPAATAPAAPVTATAPTATNQASLEPAVQTSPTAATRRAEDRLELEATQITGNRELPKVLYVVPWKRPDLGDLGGKPANSLLDEVLAPVDRDVFRRQNRYYQALKPDAAGAGSVNGTEVEK